MWLGWRYSALMPLIKLRIVVGVFRVKCDFL